MKSFWIFLLLPFSAAAQLSRIDTDRPDQTESAFLVPAKWMQFEMGFNKQRSNKQGDHEYLHPTLLSKFAFDKNIELRLITTLQTLTTKTATVATASTSGLVPVEIGGKIRLCEEKGIVPKTALIFHVAIPELAGKAFRARKWAPNFRFVMQTSITHNMALGYNLGAEWDGFSNEATWIYTFAPGFNLGNRWYGYVEAFGFISKTESPSHNLDAGLAWYATNDLKLDISGGGGISKAAPPYYFSVGASVRVNTAAKRKI